MKENPIDYFEDMSFEAILQSTNGKAAEVKNTIECIDDMMKAYAPTITYTQLRNILQVVKKEEYKDKAHFPSFYQVLPRLAYMEARPQKKAEGKKIITFIRELAGAVEEEQYESFIEIMNTIVAYHKLHG